MAVSALEPEDRFPQHRGPPVSNSGTSWAEQRPLDGGSTRAVVAATAAHRFERPAFYAEAHRILVPGGILAIVEYVRDRGVARSPPH